MSRTRPATLIDRGTCSCWVGGVSRCCCCCDEEDEEERESAAADVRLYCAARSRIESMACSCEDSSSLLHAVLVVVEVFIAESDVANKKQKGC